MPAKSKATAKTAATKKKTTAKPAATKKKVAPKAVKKTAPKKGKAPAGSGAPLSEGGNGGKGPGDATKDVMDAQA